MTAKTGYQLDCLPKTCHNCGPCRNEQWFCVGSDGGQRGAGPGEQVLEGALGSNFRGPLV